VWAKRNVYRILVGKPEGKRLNESAKFDMTRIKHEMTISVGQIK
jgi:hypothetical protein